MVISTDSPGEVSATLYTPDNSAVTIFDPLPCGGSGDISASFNSRLETEICSMSPGESSLGRSWSFESPGFNVAQEPTQGDWVLVVRSNVEGTELRAWSVTYCVGVTSCGPAPLYDWYTSSNSLFYVLLNVHYYARSWRLIVAGVSEASGDPAALFFEMGIDGVTTKVLRYSGEPSCGLPDQYTERVPWAIVFDSNARRAPDQLFCRGNVVTAMPEDSLDPVDEEMTYALLVITVGGDLAPNELTSFSWVVNCDNPCYHFYPALIDNLSFGPPPSVTATFDVTEDGAVRDISLELQLSVLDTIAAWSALEVFLRDPRGIEIVVLTSINATACSVAGAGFRTWKVMLKDDAIPFFDPEEPCVIFSPFVYPRSMRPHPTDRLFEPLLGRRALGTWTVGVRARSGEVLEAGSLRYAVLGLCVVDECPARTTSATALASPASMVRVPLWVANDPRDMVWDVAVSGVVLEGVTAGGVTLTLEGPSGARVELFSSTCEVESGMVVLSFHDRAQPPQNGECLDDSGVTVRPVASLMGQFEGQRIAGEWTLVVGNSGSSAVLVRSWGIRFNCACNEMLTAAEATPSGSLDLAAFRETEHKHLYGLAADLHLEGTLSSNIEVQLNVESNRVHTFIGQDDVCIRSSDDQMVHQIADSARPHTLYSQRLERIASPGILPCPPVSGLAFGSPDRETNGVLAPLRSDPGAMGVSSSGAGSTIGVRSGTVSACTSRCASYTSTRSFFMEPDPGLAKWGTSPVYVRDPIPLDASSAGFLPITVTVNARINGDPGFNLILLQLEAPGGTVCGFAPSPFPLTVLSQPMTFDFGTSGDGDWEWVRQNGSVPVGGACNLDALTSIEGQWTLWAGYGSSTGARATIDSWTITFGCEQCVDWSTSPCTDRAPCAPLAFQTNDVLSIPAGSTVVSQDLMDTRQYEDRTVNMVHVSAVAGVHDDLSALRVTLRHVARDTRVVLWDGGCSGQSGDFALSFSDGAPLRELRCPLLYGETYRPVEPLSAFVGLPADGPWELELTGTGGAIGELATWGLHVCEGDPDLFVAGGSAPLTELVHAPSVTGASFVDLVNDFGDVAVSGDSLELTFTMRNDGDGAIRIDSIVMLGASGAFVFTDQPVTPFVLQPKLSATFSIEFDPLTVGTITPELQIMHTDSDYPMPYRFYVRGTGVAPRLVLLNSDREMIEDPDVPTEDGGNDFGGVEVSGGLKKVDFYLKNAGNAPITDLMYSGIPEGSGVFYLTSSISTPDLALIPRRFEIAFDPDDAVLYQDTLTFSYTGPDGIVTLELALQGLGIVPRILVTTDQDPATTIYPNAGPSLALQTIFGRVALDGESETRSYRIENSGGAPLQVTAVQMSLNNVDYSIANAPTAVAPGTYETFDVVYDPASGRCDDRTGTVEITTNAQSAYHFKVRGGIEDNQGPDIMPSGPIAPVTADDGVCFAVVNIAEPSATDTCSQVVSITADPEEYWTRTFPVGDTIITITATDSDGNTSEQELTVTVEDPTAPLMSCPRSLVATSCHPRVFYLEPLAVDNCGASVEQVAGRPSGSVFPVGVTENEFVATDGGGQESRCSFSVTVVQEESCRAALSTRDTDGDGFSPADGDCCETRDQCEFPFLVNPGAVEVPNGFDDDCNGVIDDTADCGLSGAQLDIASTQELLEHAPRALGICSRYDDEYDRRYGYSWKHRSHPYLSLSDGTTIESPAVEQSAVLRHYGGIQARDGAMVMLSTGAAREPGDPSYEGTDMDMGTVRPPPYEWVHAQPGGKLPYVPACGDEPAQDPNVWVYDGVRMRLPLRQPSNMRGFALDILFGAQQPSGRYPAADLCEPQQDFALVLTNAKGSPRDRNIARDATGAPFSTLNPAVEFWDMCTDFSDVGHCRLGGYRLRGTDYRGATDWHTVGCNAEPGAEHWLDVGVFDGGSPSFDSFLLVDRMRYVMEERTEATYGQQPISNIRLTRLRAVPPTLRGGETELSIIYSITNAGPHPASDIFLSFHPTEGVHFTGASGDMEGPCTWLPEKANPERTSVMYRCSAGALRVPSGGSLQGTLTFRVERRAGGIVPFAFIASTSSVDDALEDNFARITVRQ
eukprot:TRINITY_DN108_c0_g1_i1.p1 TRINITY_DN108_c0_g1~~TRINITY_DN108_c0_g1_i1.p1  ORF type:complete len:2330 (-),score=554.43 TRINITY_DN108_c0_g1_i1:391-6621(-)